MEKYEKVPLRELLEVIQQNLAFNINSIYNDIEQLIKFCCKYKFIGTEKQKSLAWKKEDLKKKIGDYLKIVVKNIIFQVKLNPNNWEDELGTWQDELIEMLKEAIKD